jgi:hypothetical protein
MTNHGEAPRRRIKLPVAEEHSTAHWISRGVPMLIMLDD